jgi:hypothetical protein
MRPACFHGLEVVHTPNLPKFDYFKPTSPLANPFT